MLIMYSVRNKFYIHTKSGDDAYSVSETHTKIGVRGLGKGGSCGKKEGSALPCPVSFHFIAVFGLSPFRRPYYLRTWNRLI